MTQNLTTDYHSLINRSANYGLQPSVNAIDGMTYCSSHGTWGCCCHSVSYYTPHVDLSGLQREVAELKDEIRKMREEKSLVKQIEDLKKVRDLLREIEK